jgi:uncharacterized OB-fold protein
MKVKAVWKPAAERQGTVTDVRYFKPEDAGQGVERPVPIKPVVLNTENARSFPGRIPLSYVYSAGLAAGRFYKALAGGKLHGSWCAGCNAVHLPPSTFCEETMARLDPDKDLRPIDPKSGIIASFTEVHEGISGERLKEPVVIVQVNFPGATGSLFGRFVGSVDAIEIGCPVELLKSDGHVGPDAIRFGPL